MRNYEIMLILPADADDRVVEGVAGRITQVLGQDGGKVGKVDRWGKRRLAYQINKQSEGLYVVVDFVADPTSLRELDRVLTLADEVVRFKVVVREDKAPAPAAGAEPGEGGAAEEAPAAGSEPATTTGGAAGEEAGEAAGDGGARAGVA